jgi:membrane protein
MQKSWRHLLMFWALMYQSSQAAASLAYTSLFAIVPLLTVMYAILSITPYFEGAADAFQQFLLSHFLPSSDIAIQEYLQKFAEYARNLTWLGLVMLGISSMMMFMTVENTLNMIWHVRQPRKTRLRLLVSSLFMVALPLFAGALFAIFPFVQSLPGNQYLHYFFENTVILTLGSILINGLVMSIVYMVVPNCTIPLIPAIKGGLLAAILFELAKKIFAWFIIHSTFNTIYGAFAAVPFFMMWIYVSWLIVLLGAQGVRYFTKHALPTI